MSLSKYYAEIYKIPMISKEEEVNLFEEYYSKDTSSKRRDAIKAKILQANLRFVFKQAKNRSKTDPDMFADLISAGNEGLLVAFEKFDPKSGVRFLSYAGWWVMQRMLKEMATMRIVSLPIWKQQLSTRIQRVKESNENITFEELRDMFPEVSEKDLKELSDTRYLTYYIEDMDEGEFEIDPISLEVEKRLDDEVTLKAVSSLPSPHREIIAKLFGFDDGKEESLTSISKSLRLSKDEVKTIKAEALEMLSKKLRA